MLWLLVLGQVSPASIHPCCEWTGVGGRHPILSRCVGDPADVVMRCSWSQGMAISTVSSVGTVVPAGLRPWPSCPWASRPNPTTRILLSVETAWILRSQGPPPRHAGEARGRDSAEQVEREARRRPRAWPMEAQLRGDTASRPCEPGPLDTCHVRAGRAAQGWAPPPLGPSRQHRGWAGTSRKDDGIHTLEDAARPQEHTCHWVESAVGRGRPGRVRAGASGAPDHTEDLLGTGTSGEDGSGKSL